MQHCLVYTGSGATSYPTALQGLSGDIFPLSSNNYIFEQPHYIQWMAAIGTNLNRCEISLPSLAQINPLSILQLNNAAQTVSSNPGVLIPTSPIAIQAGESLSVSISTSSGTTKQYVVIGVSDTPNEPAEVPGGLYTIRFTDTTTLVQGKWTALNPTFEQASLMSGRYSLCGLYAQSTNMIAVRAFTPDSKYRPGSLGYPTLGTLPSRYFLQGRNMLTFSNYLYPSIECMADAGDTSTVGYLLVKKTA